MLIIFCWFYAFFMWKENIAGTAHGLPPDNLIIIKNFKVLKKCRSKLEYLI